MAAMAAMATKWPRLRRRLLIFFTIITNMIIPASVFSGGDKLHGEKCYDVKPIVDCGAHVIVVRVLYAMALICFMWTIIHSIIIGYEALYGKHN